jgi:hypothetical protein
MQTIPFFNTVSLSEIKQAELCDRVELKFLLPLGKIQTYYAALAGGHLALSVAGNLQNAYHTYYYDTPDFAFYKDHHNGRPNRLKVRRRMYAHTNDCYFEIKRKTNGVRTEKHRTAATHIAGELTDAELSMLHALCGGNHRPEFKLSNTFNRVTFCNSAFTERITVDTSISVTGNGNVFTMEGIALVEVKQAVYNLHSAAVNSLRVLGARGGPFSKYALGVAYLFPGLKHNNFKPTMLKLEKYANGHY